MSHRVFLLASFCLAATLDAQDVPGISRIPTAGPAQYVHYDLDTHTVRVSDVPFPGQSTFTGGDQPCYANSDDQGDGFLDALLFPANDELFDWGIKICGGSDYVSRVEIGYASMAAVGNNGALTLRLYEGAHGFDIPGQQVFEMALSGLPSDGPAPPPNALIPRFATIDLGSQSFYLPDGPIGWSFENSDGQTAPLLVNVVLENGTQNFFDVYRPGPASAGNYLGTFTLPPGGASNDPFENTFWIEISENDVTATATPVPGAGNPNILLSLGPPVIGSDWGARLNLTAFPDVTQTAVLVSRNQLSGVQTPFGELLADPGALAAPISILPGNIHNFSIPLDNDLIGQTFTAQGAFLSTSQGFRLTNGRALLVGTF